MPILPLLPRSFHYAPFWIPFRLCLSVRGSVLGCRAVVTWRVACQAALWAAARLSGGACLDSPNGWFLERGLAFAVAGMPVRLMNNQAPCPAAGKMGIRAWASTRLPPRCPTAPGPYGGPMRARHRPGTTVGARSGACRAEGALCWPTEVFLATFMN